MTTIVVETRIAAPIEVCFDLGRDVDVHIKTSSFTGERAVGGKTTGLLELGDVVTFEAVHFGIRQRLTSRIVEFDRPRRFVDEMVDGAFASLRHLHEFLVDGDSVLMRDTLMWRSPLGSEPDPAVDPVTGQGAAGGGLANGIEGHAQKAGFLNGVHEATILQGPRQLSTNCLAEWAQHLLRRPRPSRPLSDGDEHVALGVGQPWPAAVVRSGHREGLGQQARDTLHELGRGLGPPGYLDIGNGKQPNGTGCDPDGNGHAHAGLLGDVDATAGNSGLVPNVFHDLAAHVPQRAILHGQEVERAQRRQPDGHGPGRAWQATAATCCRLIHSRTVHGDRSAASSLERFGGLRRNGRHAPTRRREQRSGYQVTNRAGYSSDESHSHQVAP